MTDQTLTLPSYLAETLLAPHPVARDRALFEAGECVPITPEQLKSAAANITAFDDVTPELIPLNVVPRPIHAMYYANGPFANLGRMEAHLGSNSIIAPTLLRDPVADLKQYKFWQHGLGVDVEPQLFTPAQAAVIAKRAIAQGIMPRVYGPLSWIPQIVAALHAVGIQPGQVQIRSAHWTYVPHICSGIATVWGTISVPQTQYTDQFVVGGVKRSLDGSLCRAGSFGPWGEPAPTPPKPTPAPKPKPTPAPKPTLHPTGKANFAGSIDFDKTPGNRISIHGTAGTWKGEIEPMLFQAILRPTGEWDAQGIPNDTAPLGKTTSHPKPPAPKPPAPKPVPAPSGHNPLPDAEALRVDQGGDYNLSLTKGGVAPFQVKVLRVVDFTQGWKGGWVVCEIVGGKFDGQGFYAAEGLKAVVKEGDTVEAGKQIVEAAPNFFFNPPLNGNCEWGWVADDANRPLCKQLGSKNDQDEIAITCGLAWDKFVRDLGGPACHNNSGLQPNWSLLPAKLRGALGV